MSKGSAHLELGRRGEDDAASFLEKIGFCIIERNRRDKCSEVDIIATEGNELVFVEVRAKSNEKFGTPEETINSQKKTHLLRGANKFIADRDYRGLARIDAVCVVYADTDGALTRLTHYRNITG